MTTPLAKWLAEVDLKAKSKTVYATINLLQNWLWLVLRVFYFVFFFCFTLTLAKPLRHDG